jgi:transcriptional regulator with XRE-family HTH domain
MDGNWLAGNLVRDLRRTKNLSQRALAQLAEVPQPTISEIESGRREPSLTLLSKLAEATGQTLEIGLVPLDRDSAVATARRIAERLSPGPDGAPPDSVRVDGALRAVLNLRDALRGVDEEEIGRLVRTPPVLTGFTPWDAFLAAVVEDESARKDVAPPRWTNDRRRFAKPFWYLSKNPALHQWELDTAPAAFVRHGILAAAAELESV